MQGPPQPPELRGVIPNAFAHIFEFVKASRDVEFLVRCSYLEIYNEEIRDLLAPPKSTVKCEIKEDPNKGVFIKGLTDSVVESEEGMAALLEKGLQCRTVAATQMNAESSRSHSIFTIVVEMSTKDETTGKDMLRVGKLNLVDLAGSERQKKTQATGSTLKEGSKINLSLSALGNVISALADGKTKHIPYRDSKLTRLLQDSLGGNTKTLMVAAIGPADYNYDESMSTLRYANRAKNIKNKPKINEDPKDAMLREFKDEIAKLKSMLAAAANGVPLGAGFPYTPSASLEQDAYAGNMPHGGGGSGPIVEKVIVKEVEVASKALLDERDMAHQQLKQREHDLAQERQMREELMQRMQQLQSHLMGSSTGGGGMGNLEAGNDQGQTVTNTETPEQEEERKEAARRHKERRQKMKERRKQRQQEEMNRVVEEKQAMEEALEELRQSTQSSADQTEKKLKKKYEKKIQALRSELDDAQDDFNYQRQQLMDTIKEQEKDCKLYEQICRSLLSEKEFKRMVEKARWNEDDEEWIVPFPNKKGGVDVMEANFSYSQPSHSNPSRGGALPPTSSSSSLYGSVGSSFPPISSSSSLLPAAFGATTNFSTSSNSSGGGGSSFLPTLGGGGAGKLNNFGSGGGAMGGGGLPSLGGGGMGGLDYPGMGSRERKGLGSGGNSQGKYLLEDGLYVGGQSDMFAQTMVMGGHLGGGGIAAMDSNEAYELAEKKKKKKKKKAKAAAAAAAAAAAQQQQMLGHLPDEAGNGENAGEISEWGFAMNDNDFNGPSSEPEYSDDEDFEQESYPGELTKGKDQGKMGFNAPPLNKPPLHGSKSKGANNGKVPSLPTNEKSSNNRSPRAMGTSLPAL